MNIQIHAEMYKCTSTEKIYLLTAIAILFIIFCNISFH